MQTTDQLRAARQGRPLQLGPATGGGWLTDANGDLLENDAPEDDIQNREHAEAPPAWMAALSEDRQPLGKTLAGALRHRARTPISGGGRRSLG